MQAHWTWQFVCLAQGPVCMAPTSIELWCSATQGPNFCGGSSVLGEVERTPSAQVLRFDFGIGLDLTLLLGPGHCHVYSVAGRGGGRWLLLRIGLCAAGGRHCCLCDKRMDVPHGHTSPPLLSCEFCIASWRCHRTSRVYRRHPSKDSPPLPPPPNFCWLGHDPPPAHVPSLRPGCL